MAILTAPITMNIRISKLVLIYITRNILLTELHAFKLLFMQNFSNVYILLPSK